MKLRLTSLIAILLAMFIANAGIVQAAILACQNKCEQPQAKQIDVPECCRGMMDTDHSSSQTNSHNMSPGDCPHVEGNNQVVDSLAFITPSNRNPAPAKAPVITGIAEPSPTMLSNIRSQQHPNNPDFLPSDITFPPPYRLFCSLLI